MLDGTGCKILNIWARSKVKSASERTCKDISFVRSRSDVRGVERSQFTDGMDELWWMSEKALIN